MVKLCKNCKHYNGGDGDYVCDICDSTFNDMWDGFTAEEDRDDSRDETDNASRG